MEINIYLSKISKLSDLREKLEENGFEFKEEKKVIQHSLTLQLYIESKEQAMPKWLSEASNFFGITIDDWDNKKYNGIWVVKTSKNTYLLSKSHAFWTVEKLADPDWGLDFAERTISEKNIDFKATNYFQKNKLRSLTNYKAGQTEFPKTNEIYLTVSGKPEFELFYGKRIDCSMGVKIGKQYSLAEDKIDNFYQLFHELDTTLTRPQKSHLPRMTKVKDKHVIAQLEKKSISELKNNDGTSQLSLDINRIQIQGNIPTIISNDDELQLYTSKSKTSPHIATLSQTDLEQFIRENIQEISQLDDIKIKIKQNNGVSDWSKEISLSKIVQIELQHDNHLYILQDGKWGYLNQKFETVLQQNLNEINEIIDYNPNFDNLATSDEDEYIKKFKANSNYIILHKHFSRLTGQSIEIADLYDKQKSELIAIKMGLDTKLAIHSFNQTELAIQQLTNSKANIINEFNTNKPKSNKKPATKKEILKMLNTKNACVLWVLDTEPQYMHDMIKNKNVDLNKIKSVFVKMKIAAWYNFVREEGFEPKLYFATI